MNTNSTFAAIRTIKYGYNVIANCRTYKTRLTANNADIFFSTITESNKKHVSVFRTNKGYCFIAIVAHYAESIWDDLAFFHGILHNNKLRAKAAKKQAIAAKKLAEANAILAWLPPAEPTPIRTQPSWIDELPF